MATFKKIHGLLKSFLFIAAMMFFAPYASASINYDNIRFKHITINDGLTNNTVSSIVQGRDGFIWIGTSNGLCNYDGYSIEKFLHDPEDSTSIFHNYIRTLTNDILNNCLWITTDKGFGNYNYTDEKFKEYKIDGKSKGNVYLLITHNGDILVSTVGGIYRYSLSEDTFVDYIPMKKKSLGHICEDSKNTLWIDCDQKIVRYDLSEDRFLRLPETLADFSKPIRNTHYLTGDKLLFTDYFDCFIYDIQEDKITKLEETEYTKGFRCAMNDQNGNIWIGTEFGIFIYNQKLELIKHLDSSVNDKSNLNDRPVYCIYSDNNDNIWVGTYFGGINCFISDSDKFQIYPSGQSDRHLSGKAAREIKNDSKGGLLIATEDGGLNYLDKEGKVTHSDIVHKVLGIGDAKNVHSVMFDCDNNIWIGLYQKGLVKYNYKEKKSYNLGKALPFNTSGFCLEESKGRIWYGGQEGLYKVDRENKDKISLVKKDFIYCSLKINDSTILFGSRYNGLCRLNTKTEKLVLEDLLPKGRPFVTNLYMDTQERLWVGTNNDGLYVFDNSFNQIKQFGREELESDAIKGMIEDKYGNMWIGTDNGLCCVRDSGWSVNRYTVSDGLPTNQFNYCSACRKEDGQLFFGTINGLISFYPENVYDSDNHFDIKLTKLWSGSKRLSPLTDKGIECNISQAKKIIFTHKEAQSLKIEYSGMNFKYGDNTQYAMILEGLEKEWQYVGNQHQVRFSNLPSGKYTLKIVASSDSRNWDKNGLLSIPIRVKAPWWATTWAFLVYGVIIVLIALYSYKYTKTRLLLQMKLKAEQEKRRNIEKLNHQKTAFFTYVSHDLKTPLTLILSPLQRLTEQENLTNDDKDKLEVIYSNAYRMNYLIDELLTFSKIEMNQMHIHVRKGNIMNFLQGISGIFHMVGKNKDIDFITDLEEEEQDVWFSPSKLERIIYNLLSNAFKYCETGDTVKLTAHFKRNGTGDTMVEINVRDTGRGIPGDMQKKIFENYFQVNMNDENKGTGLGLALTRSLVNLHKGEITLQSEPGKGSIFTVTLNVSESAYTEEERSADVITDAEMDTYNKEMAEHIEMRKDELEDKNTLKEHDCLMIVEDNKEMNDYISDIFQETYEIIQVYNGREACKILEKKLPDVIISDIMMSEMDGLELLKNVKENLQTSHIPVILLTAKTDEGDQTKGYMAGADAYIAKPFNAKNLELLVSNLKKNIRLNIEHFKKAEELNITQITNNPKDEKFMSELMGVIEENISNEDFNVNEITSTMHISRSLLHNKVKALSGCSTTQFIRTIKMKKAKSLLLEGKNVSETSYAIGISDPHYFSKCFKKEFDISPSEFLKEGIQKT